MPEIYSSLSLPRGSAQPRCRSLCPDAFLRLTQLAAQHLGLKPHWVGTTFLGSSLLPLSLNLLRISFSSPELSRSSPGKVLARTSKKNEGSTGPSPPRSHGIALKPITMSFHHVSEGIELRCRRALAAPCPVANVFSVARVLSNPYTTVVDESALTTPAPPCTLNNSLSNVSKAWKRLLSEASLVGCQTVAMDYVTIKNPMRELGRPWAHGTFGIEGACGFLQLWREGQPQRRNVRKESLRMSSK